MIYPKKPDEFNPKFEVVSCFIECDKEILLLHRQDHKPEGGTWGTPTGKVNNGEKILDTMVREIREETGLTIPGSNIKYFGKFYVKYPNYDFLYHMFSTHLDKKQRVVINPEEHKGFKWVSPNHALDMQLILDMDTCIKFFYKI